MLVETLSWPIWVTSELIFRNPLNDIVSDHRFKKINQANGCFIHSHTGAWCLVKLQNDKGCLRYTVVDKCETFLIFGIFRYETDNFTGFSSCPIAKKNEEKHSQLFPMH